MPQNRKIFNPAQPLPEPSEVAQLPRTPAEAYVSQFDHSSSKAGVYEPDKTLTSQDGSVTITVTPTAIDLGVPSPSGPSGPLVRDLGNVSTDQTIDCAGYNSIMLSMVATVKGLTLNLQHVSTGDVVWIRVDVLASGNATVKVAMTKPDNTSYLVRAVPSGGGPEIDLTATGVSVPNNGAMYLGGAAAVDHVFLKT